MKIYGKYNIPTWVYTRMALEMHDDCSIGLRTLEIMNVNMLAIKVTWKCGATCPELVSIDLQIEELYVSLLPSETDWSRDESFHCYERLLKP